MNKIEIIQRLLDDRHITAKEAMTLMEKEYVYYSYYNYPYSNNQVKWEVGYPLTGTSADFTISTN